MKACVPSSTLMHHAQVKMRPRCCRAYEYYATTTPIITNIGAGPGAMGLCASSPDGPTSTTAKYFASQVATRPHANGALLLI